MKELLWFCKTNDSSSLARITDSLIPLLKSQFNITLLSNKTNIKDIKNVIIGEDTKSVTYIDFLKKMPGAFKNGKINDENIRSINMKYILIQMVDLIYDGNYDYVLICNGIYEIDWITKILTSSPTYLTNQYSKKTKLVVWAPIDYIPSIGVIKNILKADLFLTMTPVMKTEIENILQDQIDKVMDDYRKGSIDSCIKDKSLDELYNCKLDWVGHGSDITSEIKLPRQQLVEKLNKMHSDKLIMSKHQFTVNDIIILNANNYGPLDPMCDSVENTPGTRKRLDLTIKAFLKVLETNKNIKLWIHTNLKSFFEMLAIENILLSTFVDNIILSNNSLTNEQLGFIYQMSNISIQTSYAEGWSLTNLEASLYRSLQIVPDFLATGWHYKDNRGLLIPITRKTIKNEGNLDVIIGEVSIEDTAVKILEALELLKNEQELDHILTDAYDYAKSYSWSSIADKLILILD